jgi:hypothetical protein
VRFRKPTFDDEQS